MGPRGPVTESARPAHRPIWAMTESARLAYGSRRAMTESARPAYGSRRPMTQSERLAYGSGGPMTEESMQRQPSGSRGRGPFGPDHRHRLARHAHQRVLVRPDDLHRHHRTHEPLGA